MHDATADFRAAVLAALGHAPDNIEPGLLHRFSTSDRRGDSAGWCKLFDDQRAGVFGDWRTGTSETWSAVDRAKMTQQERTKLARRVEAAAREREAERRREWAENRHRIAALWAQCVPLVPGDPATLYLKRRGIAGAWPLPACLRYHPALRYWHDDGTVTEHPGMVAPLVNIRGETVALHRTFLRRDGGKAEVPTVRKLTPTAGALAGAAIPLFKPERGRIGIAEGVETALAAWLGSGVPTMAAYSAGNLAAWQWPPDARRILIFADHDPAGLEAANALHARATAAGRSCSIHAPSDAGADWGDVWEAGRVALGEAV